MLLLPGVLASIVITLNMCLSASVVHVQDLLPNISTTSISQLTALPAEVRRLHLSNHLTTTGTKAVMAC